jgi:hypothetical protein
MEKKNEMRGERDRILGVRGMWRWVRKENLTHQPVEGLIVLVVLTVAIFQIGAILTSCMCALIWIAGEGVARWTAWATQGRFLGGGK